MRTAQVAVEQDLHDHLVHKSGEDSENGAGIGLLQIAHGHTADGRNERGTLESGSHVPECLHHHLLRPLKDLHERKPTNHIRAL